MTHYFITCYFNYCGYKSRYLLTKQFIERYPNVILIEVAFENQPFIFHSENVLHFREEKVFWASYKYINEFIKNKWNSLKSLTFIDSDVLLYDDFFDDIIHVYENTDKPLYLQPYHTSREFIGSNIVERPGVIYMYKNTKTYSCEYHTGLCYSFNKKFLELTGYIPECLLLGGLDQFLYYCIFKLDKHIEFLYNQIKNEKIIKELKAYRHRYNIIKSENWNYLEGCVYTYEHGKKINRGYNTRVYLYENINNEICKKYFSSRLEDENN